jgi:hypothetical protein
MLTPNFLGLILTQHPKRFVSLFESARFLSELCAIPNRENADSRLNFWGSSCEESLYSAYHTRSTSFVTFIADIPNAPHYKAFKEARFHVDSQIANLEFHTLFFDPLTKTNEYFFSDPMSDFLQKVPPVEPHLKDSLNSDTIQDIIPCHPLFYSFFEPHIIRLLTKG